MARISVIPLFKDVKLSAGDSLVSDKIDLRYAANSGQFALVVGVASGTAGTVGTTVFTYSGCAIEEGTYISPSGAPSIGTYGTAGSADIVTFEPELMPFMKVTATQTGTGTAGFDSIIEATLIVQ